MDESTEFENKDGTKETKPFALRMYASPYISYKADKITNYHKFRRNVAWKEVSHDEAKEFDFEKYL